MLLSNLSKDKYATRFKKLYYPENEDPMIKYEQVIPWEYTASTDGETVIIIPELVGALRLTQIEKEIKPIKEADYSFNSSSGQINLLNGVSMAAGETLFILYVKLVTS
jgi:hypothetical protein